MMVPSNMETTGILMEIHHHIATLFLPELQKEVRFPEDALPPGSLEGSLFQVVLTEEGVIERLVFLEDARDFNSEKIQESLADQKE